MRSSATSLEKALLRLAESVQTFPAAKSLLLFGWGLGRWRPVWDSINTDDESAAAAGYLHFSRTFSEAKRLLQASHTTVFSLDISDSGYHPLQGGLEKISFETGGFYVPTSSFPELAMTMVARAITGYYEIVFHKPQRRKGSHEIRVTVLGVKAAVLHRSFYED